MEVARSQDSKENTCPKSPSCRYVSIDADPSTLPKPVPSLPSSPSPTIRSSNSKGDFPSKENQAKRCQFLTFCDKSVFPRAKTVRKTSVSSYRERSANSDELLHLFISRFCLGQRVYKRVLCGGNDEGSMIRCQKMLSCLISTYMKPSSSLYLS